MPPKGARSSARSAANRNQASSPPKESTVRQSQSPTGIGRRTRSTRSQSRDFGDDGIATARNKRKPDDRSRGRRSESVESSGSKASDRGYKRQKVAPRDQATDLFVVVEDGESDNSGNELVDEEGAGREGDGGSPGRRSPAALSQISGTTAITSMSFETSYSKAEVSRIDPIVAEILPELFRSSYRILDLLAPAGATPDRITPIMNELKIHGSRRAKKLKYEEDKFKLSRDQYPTTTGDYIPTEFVLRGLLGSSDPGPVSYRPDAIIQAANLAILVKEIMVIQKESEQAHVVLTSLFTCFPMAFVNKFGKDAIFGDSASLEDAFDMSLEFYTQLVIANLRRDMDLRTFDPEKVLLSIFYENIEGSSSTEPNSGDASNNRRPRYLNQKGIVPSEQHIESIQQRVEDIRIAFRNEAEAREADDIVDFDILEESFPWVGFLTTLTRWSRSRLEEIFQSIKQQGGVEELTKNLIDEMMQVNSQLDVVYEEPPSITKPRPEPEKEAIPSGTNRRQYVPGLASAVDDAKRGKPIRPGVESSKHAEVRPTPSTFTEPQGDGDPEPPDDYFDGDKASNEDEEMVGTAPPRPSAEYIKAAIVHRNDNNKENRPIQKQFKQRLIDSQPGAVSMSWDSLPDDVGTSNQRRPQQRRDPSEESEDQGFQEDERLPDPARRRAVPLDRSQGPAHTNISAPTNSQSAHREAEDGYSVDDESLDDIPPPTCREMSDTAKSLIARAKPIAAPQKRVQWSEADEGHLIDLVEEYGCSWAKLERMGEFEKKRGQVALKDKARTMKANMIINETPLPLNFEHIALSATEKARIRKRWPDYEFD